jgi:hypothetical protein
LFDRLAWRYLSGGSSDDEALSGIAEHLANVPGPFGKMPEDARARIVAIRATVPPPRSEAESWAMLDAALGAGVPTPALERPTSARTRSGPKPSTTKPAVEAARARLIQAGEPSGERAIAAHLGVSRGAVRYALGKDRRAPA